MSQTAGKTGLEDLDIKPYVITKLKMAGIHSIFDLADINNDMLTGTNEQVALELVTKAKKALVDSGLLFKDFSTAEQILERRRNLLKCTGAPLSRLLHVSLPPTRSGSHTDKARKVR
jgi:hypothetical protein